MNNTPMRRFFLFISFLSFIISPALAQNDLRNYKMAGPYEVVARDGKYPDTATLHSALPTPLPLSSTPPSAPFSLGPAT